MHWDNLHSSRNWTPKNEERMAGQGAHPLGSTVWVRAIRPATGSQNDFGIERELSEESPSSAQSMHLGEGRTNFDAVRGSDDGGDRRPGGLGTPAPG
jgi:hypothetical protein